MRTETHKEIYLKDYQPTPYMAEKIDLYFDLNEDHTDIKSVVSYLSTGTKGSPLILDGVDLELITIRLNGKDLEKDAYKIDGEELIISNPPKEFELEITCRTYPHKNTSLEGLYKSSGNYCTQCEAEGFRKITYFYDRPDVMTKYTTYMESDKSKYPVLLSNGNLLEKGDLNNGRHWAKWEDPFKKPSYLFALVAGDLGCLKDTYKTMSGREVSLEIYAIDKDLDKCHFAMESLKKSMKWDEDTYGLEYDLDTYMIVAVSDFNMGAMENKGLNVFNTSAVLASEKTSTDDDFHWVEGVIGHEYFHNWTGNRVTCRDWFQLCLKEGLTVFRDQEFSSDMGSRDVCRIDAIKSLRASQFLEDSGPMAHPARPSSFVEINNFYTSTVYNKGAEICRMIHTVLGKEGFRKGMDCYFKRFDGQAVTIEDFIKAMGDGSGTNIDSFLDWYTQSGTPHIHVDTEFNSDQQTYTLKLKQINPSTPDQKEKKPLIIPMITSLLDPNGQNLPLQLEGENKAQGTERLFIWEGSDASFTFTNITEEPVPSLFRGFSAPIIIHNKMTEEDQLFLMAHDSDPINRWDVTSSMISREILRLIEERRQGNQLHLNEKIIEGFRKTLTNNKLDKAFRALAMQIPSEKELALKMNPVDVEGISEIRRMVVIQLAKNLKNELLETYEANKSTGTFSPDAESAGKRALQNVTLAFLGTLNEKETNDLITKQFESATNMSEELAAFMAINQVDSPERKNAINKFFNKWTDEELVIDYWFEAQALSTLDSAMESIKALTEHERYDIKNPNRARSLLRNFSENIKHFHHISGDGYQLMADHILKIDPLNPQLASAFGKTFSIWNKLDDQRKSLIKNQLERIKSQKISNDLNEVIKKLLAVG